MCLLATNLPVEFLLAKHLRRCALQSLRGTRITRWLRAPNRYLREVAIDTRAVSWRSRLQRLRVVEAVFPREVDARGCARLRKCPDQLSKIPLRYSQVGGLLPAQSPGPGRRLSVACLADRFGNTHRICDLTYPAKCQRRCPRF